MSKNQMQCLWQSLTNFCWVSFCFLRLSELLDVVLQLSPSFSFFSSLQHVRTTQNCRTNQIIYRNYTFKHQTSKSNFSISINTRLKEMQVWLCFFLKASITFSQAGHTCGQTGHTCGQTASPVVKQHSLLFKLDSPVIKLDSPVVKLPHL